VHTPDILLGLCFFEFDARGFFHLPCRLPRCPPTQSVCAPFCTQTYRGNSMTAGGAGGSRRMESPQLGDDIEEGEVLPPDKLARAKQHVRGLGKGGEQQEGGANNGRKGQLPVYSSQLDREQKGLTQVYVCVSCACAVNGCVDTLTTFWCRSCGCLDLGPASTLYVCSCMPVHQRGPMPTCHVHHPMILFASTTQSNAQAWMRYGLPLPLQPFDGQRKSRSLHKMTPSLIS